MAHEVLIPPKVAAEIEAIGDRIARDNPQAARAMMERPSTVAASRSTSSRSAAAPAATATGPSTSDPM
jgi:hypothetical protein